MAGSWNLSEFQEAQILEQAVSRGRDFIECLHADEATAAVRSGSPPASAVSLGVLTLSLIDFPGDGFHLCFRKYAAQMNEAGNLEEPTKRGDRVVDANSAMGVSWSFAIPERYSSLRRTWSPWSATPSLIPSPVWSA